MSSPLAALSLLVVATLTAQQPSPEQAPTQPPQELGKVTFGRDLDAALATSKQTGRPVFLLFQEIPGCATCTGFGKDVLSHPLLVEAIEREFVPVVVRNNVEGPEGEIRKRFVEPAWNNPVVRFLDGQQRDLLPRRDGVFDPHGIATRMAEALAAAKRPLPGYLQIARDESDRRTERAVFAMHCFWEGEAVLGALDGVVATRSAFHDGAEVVEVTFLPARIGREPLTQAAAAKSCRPVVADAVKAAPSSDQQHALGGTLYGKLPLTPMQRTKVHAALTLAGAAAERDADAWLSPSQVAELARLRAAARADRSSDTK
ncbi:MAG: VPGUxxT family thioredoxin-like (seleno)protein, type 2 [Planctomycetota bacterium]